MSWICGMTLLCILNYCIQYDTSKHRQYFHSFTYTPYINISANAIRDNALIIYSFIIFPPFYRVNMSKNQTKQDDLPSSCHIIHRTFRTDDSVLFHHAVLKSHPKTADQTATWIIFSSLALLPYFFSNWSVILIVAVHHHVGKRHHK